MKTQLSLSLDIREHLRKLIVQKIGLEIRDQNIDDFEQIIIMRTRKLGFDNTKNYLNFLSFQTRDSQKEWEELVSQLTNNESYFFRDQGQFKLLKETIFPELIQQKKFSKSLRICSAGCSTGPEPYSLAIVLKELIPNIQQWNILILGVDINQDVLDVAKKGIYSPWSFRRVDEVTKEKYFNKMGEQYKINDDIKQLIKFEVCNLVEETENSKKSSFYNIDLIVCRNVFIYFSQDTIEKILNNFYKKLQPSGYLLTGHAEIFSQNSSIKKFKKNLFFQSLIYQKPKLGEFVQTREFSSVAKKDPSVKPIKNKINTDTFKVIPKSPQPLSKFTTNLLNSSEQAKNTSVKEIDHKIEINKIKLLLKNKNYNLVIQKLKTILEQSPHDLDYLYLLAETYANMGQYEQAINHCKAAIKIDHLSLNFYYLLAEIYEEKEDFGQTQTILNQIIYLDTDSVYGYFKLGNFYHSQGNAKKARKMYQNTLKILHDLPENQLIPELNDLSVQELIIKLSNL